MKVGSLFCGCGGMDLGLIGNFNYLGKKYEKLPYEIVFAVDNEEKAIATYNKNFLRSGAIMDVKALGRNIPDIDILVGGFPCQSFSTVNPTKNPFDSRAKLYHEMARILELKKPFAFIAENVKGLMTLNEGKILESVKEEFASKGYNVSHKLLNAADFGVPQKRQRLFIIGIREDLDFEFKYPETTHSENEEENKQMWVRIRKAISDCKPADKKYFFSQRAVEGMKKAKNNMKRGLYQDLDKPCLTITSHLAKQSLNSRDPVLLVNKKKEVYRRFTPEEAASIQSFPKKFKFVGSDFAKYQQIGNAVPPVLMWHVSRALAYQLISRLYAEKYLLYQKQILVNFPSRVPIYA